ncbi:hypothetical protein EB796_024792 [Bugula neritina]|uniref:Calcineurin-like phosphoesterase domain-containing protein n=1 Tax=Bugula neritina TaxID=10212 RepID=A0A7J7IU16_BUGNE|nr:hypothetical protein EB796_024792 [Bugula neritina]
MTINISCGHQLTIFHFNDVYNIEPAKIEPQGGAARMVTTYKSIRDRNPMVLFSGDCLNPSMISSVEKGNQMLPVFEALNVSCAVLGNHEFDFGLEVLENFMGRCSFPWLLSNVLDKCTGEIIAGAKETHMVDWNGIKVGLLGLAEQDWLVTLPTLDFTDMVFTDYVACATDLSERLRQQGADVVIALTHMRMKNDITLAEKVPGVDIILGGHDHDYHIEQIEGRYIIKSGTDFQNASIITLNMTPDKKIGSVDIEEITLDSTVIEDEPMKDIVDSYLGNVIIITSKLTLCLRMISI